MGVRLINVADGDSVVAIARNAEPSVEDSEIGAEEDSDSVSLPTDVDSGGDDHGGSGGGADDRED
jgi:hypothetical protein